MTPIASPSTIASAVTRVSFTLRTGSVPTLCGVARLPLMLRALVLVPLLAVGLDQARASFLCGPNAQSCLDAAGQGWLGAAGTLLLVVYMLGIAALVARVARGRGAPTLLWVVATAGLWAACGGQALLGVGAGRRRRTGRRLAAAAGDRHRRRRAARAGAAGRPRAGSRVAAGRSTAHRCRARNGAARRHRSCSAAPHARRRAGARPCSTRDRLATAGERRALREGRESRPSPRALGGGA